MYNQMVVDRVDDGRADTLLHALADATRRDILRRAIGGGLSVTALAREYPMSFAAVQKHVAVLHKAGLVTKHPRGRERLVRTDVTSIQLAALVLDDLEATWRDRIDRIDALLAERDATGGQTTDSPTDSEGDPRCP
jgi:DNA-binding transcriptional ArsR family regulator